MKFKVGDKVELVKGTGTLYRNEHAKILEIDEYDRSQPYQVESLDGPGETDWVAEPNLRLVK